MAKYYFDHTHLISPDPEKTAEFYKNAFDAEELSVDKQPDGRTMVRLTLGGTSLLISSVNDSNNYVSPEANEKRFGLQHFGVGTDNLEKLVARMKAKGIRVTRDVTLLASGTKIAFILTPENVVIELLERH